MLEKFPILLELKWMPDGDDIGFRINSAFKVQKRLVFLNYITKSILNNQAEGFL